ncbi:MAG: CppA family protein [Streptococcaceae bacterium]|nr:CppA family protein [Streptococcaceae bacterium]
MKTIFEHVNRMVPVIRVNNRDLNLAFYQETLGLKVISEENALAILGGKSAKTRQDARLILEESPSMRTRAVDGVKKLRKIVLESPAFTEGFQAVSPEGDLFEVVPVSSDSQDVRVVEIQLNTPNLTDSLAFYGNQFGLRETNQTFALPFGQISYVAAEGPDLLADPEKVWDLEVIEFEVAAEVDLKEFAGQLDEAGLTYYIDKKSKVLALKDAQNLEIWFMK